MNGLSGGGWVSFLLRKFGSAAEEVVNLVQAAVSEC